MVANDQETKKTRFRISHLGGAERDDLRLIRTRIPIGVAIGIPAVPAAVSDIQADLTNDPRIDTQTRLYWADTLHRFGLMPDLRPRGWDRNWDDAFNTLIATTPTRDGDTGDTGDAAVALDEAGQDPDWGRTFATLPTATGRPSIDVGETHLRPWTDLTDDDLTRLRRSGLIYADPVTTDYTTLRDTIAWDTATLASDAADDTWSRPTPDTLTHSPALPAALLYDRYPDDRQLLLPPEFWLDNLHDAKPTDPIDVLYFVTVYGPLRHVITGQDLFAHFESPLKVALDGPIARPADKPFTRPESPAEPNAHLWGLSGLARHLDRSGEIRYHSHYDDDDGIIAERLGRQARLLNLYQAVALTWLHLDPHACQGRYTDTELREPAPPALRDVWTERGMPAPDTVAAALVTASQYTSAMISNVTPGIALTPDIPLIRPVDITTAIGTQIQQWLLSGDGVRRCHNTTCGRFFVFQDSGDGAARHHDAMYCSRRCAKNQANRNYRRRKAASREMDNLT